MTALRRRFTVVLSVSLIAAVPLVLPVAARGASARHVVAHSTPPGSLRFDAPSYTTGGCVTTTLTYTGGLTPTLDVVSHTTGDHEHVSLTHLASGQWASTQCTMLTSKSGHANDGKLTVASGDTVFAYARNAGAVLAIGAFTIQGNRAGQGSRPKLLVRPVKLPALLASGGLGPNARIIGPNGTAVYIAERAVIVADTAPGDLAGFVRRFHGRDLGPVAIGDPAFGQHVYHTVELDPRSYNDSNFASMLASDHVTKGTFTFSSTRAEKLLALITAEQIEGMSVWPEVLQLNQDAPTANQGNDGGTSARNYFSNTWSNPQATDGSQQLRLGQAQSLIHVMRPSTKSTIAIIDGGFGGPNDFGGGFTPPAYGAPGGKYNNIPQCDIDFAGGTNCNPATGPAQGASNTPCLGPKGSGACPWHGMEMAGVAAGRLDDGWGGTAGVAAQTSTLQFYKIAFDYTLPLASGLSTAAKAGANVISISSGAPCVLGGIDLCDGLVLAGLTALCATVPIAWMGGPAAEAAALAACATLVVAASYNSIANGVSFAEAANVVVVAAAGNTHVDPSSDKLYPCVITDVVCVGGLQEATPAPTAVPDFSFGSRINIWAPGNNVRLIPDPSSNGISTVNGGTSPATAFIAGVAGVARAIDPALSAAGTRALIEGAACRPGNIARVSGPACTPSTDPTVNKAGYVDVLEVVRRAWINAGNPSLGNCTGGFDETAGKGDASTGPIALGSFPAALAGTYIDQTGIDASLTTMDHASDPAGDVRFYEFSLSLTNPLVKAVNVRATITVPDPALGTFHLSFWKVVGNTLGPPMLDAVPASLQQDSFSGTGYVQAPIVIGSDYVVEIQSLGPLPANLNCFGELRLDAERESPNPPTHEPWLEVGSASTFAPTGNAVDTRQMLIPVTLTGPLAYNVTVNYSFTDGSALGGTDYANTPGSVVIPSGATDAAIPIEILPSAPTTPIFAFVNITSGSAPVRVAGGFFSILPATAGGPVNAGDTNVWEGDTGPFKLAHVTVSLDKAAARPITVDFTTHDGTAIAGTDYAALTGSVVIPAGSETADIAILLSNANTRPEFSKSFTVQLTTTSAGKSLLGAHTTATVTILDDDPTP